MINKTKKDLAVESYSFIVVRLFIEKITKYLFLCLYAFASTMHTKMVNRCGVKYGNSRKSLRQQKFDILGKQDENIDIKGHHY